MDDPRQRLLDAAGQTFAEKGFEAATVREICAAAGMNVASVNYHFGDKEKLYIEAVKAAECAGGATVTFEWPAGVSPEQKLAGFIGRMVADMLDAGRPTWHTKLMMRAMLEPTRACEDIVREFIAPKFAMLESIIEEIVPGRLSIRQRQRYAFSVVGQVLLYRFQKPVGALLVGEEEFQALSADLEVLAEHITRFTLSGLRCAGLRDGDAPAEPQRRAQAHGSAGASPSREDASLSREVVSPSRENASPKSGEAQR